MKRACFLLVAAIALLFGPASTAVEAFHRHHGGWGHFGGGGAYRHWGGYAGFGYRNWGYRPAYGFGYRSFYHFNRPFYGVGYGVYGTGLGINYGGCYPAYFQPTYFNYGVPHFYNPSPFYFNSYYGYPGCFYSSAPVFNYYYATPTINVTRIVVRKADELAPVAGATPRAAFVYVSTVGERSKARQQLKLGDTAFQAGRYIDALTRYRNAAELAKDLAEPQFRKGHAYIAHGKFELAAASFRRGLELEPSALREGFKLVDLYGPKLGAKEVHLDNLAAAALMDEDSADNYFLLGMMLRFNGEHERAEKFLVKAASLSAATSRTVARLIPAPIERPVSFIVGDEI